MANNIDDFQTPSERIACLPKDRPRVYAGPGKGATHCDGCGGEIPSGVAEYELVFEAVSFRFDRSCFTLWQSEVANN